MRTLMFMALSLLLASPQLDTDPREFIRLETTTQLTDSPNGNRLALLTDGAEATVLETRDGWVRISIEGWVPVEDTSLDPSAIAPIPSTPAVRSSGKDGLLTGAIYVTNKKGKTIIGDGTTVRLVNGGMLPKAIAGIRDECLSKRDELLADAARLKTEAGHALGRTEDTSEAFDKYDEADAKRRRVLKELKRHDDDCDFRVEALLTGNEASRGLSDAEGRFTLHRVPAGNFIVWAWFDAKKTRYIWAVPVSLQAGEEFVLDLTNLNVTRTLEIPKYK